jgi:hypothetical protein
MTLTDTRRAILTQAADHPAGLAASPATLPPAPRSAVARAMLKAGLLALVEPDKTANAATGEPVQAAEPPEGSRDQRGPKLVHGPPRGFGGKRRADR